MDFPFNDCSQSILPITEVGISFTRGFDSIFSKGSIEKLKKEEQNTYNFICPNEEANYHNEQPFFYSIIMNID